MADKLTPIINKIRTELQGEPSIRDPGKLFVSKGKSGHLFNSKHFIKVEGSVANVIEKTKVEKLCKQYGGDIEVHSELKISAPFS